ncbi:MAG: hypothetical protein ACI81V_001302 [Lentimonas sp.]|jgi:hypothetical protein
MRSLPRATAAKSYPDQAADPPFFANAMQRLPLQCGSAGLPPTRSIDKARRGGIAKAGLVQRLDLPRLRVEQRQTRTSVVTARKD